MLTMTETNVIRTKFLEEGKNITHIAQETGHDHKTIRKYINKENWNQGFSDDIRPSKLDPFKPLINKWFEDDKNQRRKQRHTARRILKRLLDETDGFDASYRTVCNYFR